MPLLLALAALISLLLAAPAGAQERTPRVVGGQAAPAGSYPWQVAVRIDGRRFCGGTLLAADLVLTAAHCTDGATSIRVGAGSTDLRGHQLVTVRGWRDHPLSVVPVADTEPVRHDLALLDLERPVAGTAFPAPVGPGDAGRWETGDELTITGWGQSGTTPAGDAVFVDALQEARVPRRPDAGAESCAAAWGRLFFAVDMVCAGRWEGGADTCVGDSGGPLLAPVADTPRKDVAADWRVVGVTSYGAEPCGRPERPGVYVRMDAPAVRSFLAAPPVRPTTAASLTGAATEGGTLTCDPGTWEGEPRFTFTFRRGSELVQQGTSDRYVLQSTDVGGRITCTVVATGAGGRVSERSAPSELVAPAPPPPPAPAPPAPAPAPAPVAPAPRLAAPPDLTAPVLRVRRRTCTVRRCVVRLTTDDETARVVARLTTRRTAACRRGGRTRRCTITRTRALTVTRPAAQERAVRTPRLGRGRHRLELVARDAAGNRSAPLVVALRAR
jgi:hypothetical protein